MAGPSSIPTADPKPRPQNQAFRMLGIPVLPRKLPSRNWLIFWTVSTTISAAIIYDKREKKRATARWARAVAPLAKIPLREYSELPRKLTIYLEAPPGDGLRVAQDHFTDYVKPVLAASGLDWDFVQGRQQGDVRAVVAERVRRIRKRSERESTDQILDETKIPTAEEIVEAVRQRTGITEYDGVRGDIVIGRNTWKEYIRGLHEGWLGPLEAPPEAIPEPVPAAKEGEEAPPASKRPPQIKPYNSVEDYPSSHLPLLMPAELAPSAPIPFPHILGMLNTPTRLRRFFNRRKLADEIGQEVAAVCFATYRDFNEPGALDGAFDDSREQQQVLVHEEENWVKSVWKEEEAPKPNAEAPKDDASPQVADEPALPEVPVVKVEKIWPKPIVFDSRIASRMRRFELSSEHRERAQAIVVPEEEIEGWIKGSLRSLWHWGTGVVAGGQQKVPPPLGNLDVA